jgi:hypothetical protein
LTSWDRTESQDASCPCPRSAASAPDRGRRDTRIVPASNRVRIWNMPARDLSFHGRSARALARLFRLRSVPAPARLFRLRNALVRAPSFRRPSDVVRLLRPRNVPVLVPLLCRPSGSPTPCQAATDIDVKTAPWSAPGTARTESRPRSVARRGSRRLQLPRGSWCGQRAQERPHPPRLDRTRRRGIRTIR